MCLRQLLQLTKLCAVNHVRRAILWSALSCAGLKGEEDKQFVPLLSSCIASWLRPNSKNVGWDCEVRR